MKYHMTKELSSRIDKEVLDELSVLRSYIPDGNIESLTEYVKCKVKWITLFNVRHVLLDYIDKNNYCYTDIGDALYKMLEYEDDNSNKKSLDPLSLSVTLMVPDEHTAVCRAYHEIKENNHTKVISQNELYDIQDLLNMTCYTKLLEFFSSEFEFILRKGVYDLNIEVNEDYDEYDKYDDN